MSRTAKYSEGKIIGAPWQEVMVERILAGEPIREVMDDYGVLKIYDAIEIIIDYCADWQGDSEILDYLIERDSKAVALLCGFETIGDLQKSGKFVPENLNRESIKQKMREGEK